MKNLLTLISIIFFFSCNNSTEPEEQYIIPNSSEVCENEYSNIDGLLVSCDIDCSQSGEDCYHQNDLNVLDVFRQSFDSLSNTNLLGIGSQNWIQGRLRSLNLYSDQLIGEIPPEIGNLTSLTHLYLNSDFTGEIPSEIGNLTNLELLSLQHNQLIGEIPPEIGNLTNLWYFNVSGNELIGKIPEIICNVYDSYPLSTFNLSQNHLLNIRELTTIDSDKLCS